MALAKIERAIAEIAAGRPVIVADSADRENEGDIIISAQLASRDLIAWMVKHSSGLLCAAMSAEIADRLDLPMMVQHNQDTRQTAYTVTVDAARGVTTGISAHDRMTTLHVLANEQATADDLRRPGHILPLRAVAGGVRARAGHTEAAVELMRLAGLAEVGVIAEIVGADGEMMRLPQLLEFGAAEGVPVITIEDLVAYLCDNEPAVVAAVSDIDFVRLRSKVALQADTLVPTKYGKLRMKSFRDLRTGIDSVAIINEVVSGAVPAVRLHSECLTGEAFGSLKCECAGQLDAALQTIASEGGIVLYLRGHEGRGIGLSNKLRAYSLQERGFDTVQANEELGLPVDGRDYETAAAILANLGVFEVRLMTNNPDKEDQLTKHGIKVAQSLPIIVEAPPESLDYLRVKGEKMRHRLSN
ncbi:3,4-dihydroxy-2-butanone-4-phosphate synthase [Canibacter sp. lx-72]|uniref:3,4-dihydroxy-2-butanone-4-phosphate synthase n=1 Tax=Canibacter zhuwentaonis TaxID=2837491 RepID=UPI001BDBEE3F|nr:3,4-dihydroxy-2-butanone-4-phosphate synthase [Canibacter zhuwentaonis]